MRRLTTLSPRPTLLSSLLLTLGLCLPWSSASAQDEGNLYNTTLDIRLGERYFQRQCSRCHGADAKGNDETGAPNLTGALRRASNDTGIFTIIRNGVAGTAMLPVPADTPDPTVWQLVAYINSLRTDPANIVLPGSATAGREHYLGKGACATCHMIGGEGGRRGPDLSLVGGRLSPEQLKTALTDPGETVDPRWWLVRATQQDGTVVEGLRMDEDTFTIRIIDEDANLWPFRKSELRDLQRTKDSIMPGYQNTLSESEIDDLVAYLFSLRKENQ